MNIYWSKENLNSLKEANSFFDLGIVALMVQEKMPNNLIHVCGPISTGGFNDVELNNIIFKKTIDKLSSSGLNVYDQTFLEEHIVRLINSLDEKNYHTDILEHIYKPLFLSRKITTAYFIHGWESSVGATWEHNFLSNLGVKIIYLQKDFVKLD